MKRTREDIVMRRAGLTHQAKGDDSASIVAMIGDVIRCCALIREVPFWPGTLLGTLPMRCPRPGAITLIFLSQVSKTKSLIGTLLILMFQTNSANLTQILAF